MTLSFGRFDCVTPESEESNASVSAAATRNAQPKLLAGAADQACRLVVTSIVLNPAGVTLAGAESAATTASTPSAWTPGVVFHGLPSPNELQTSLALQVCSSRWMFVTFAMSFDTLTVSVAEVMTAPTGI